MRNPPKYAEEIAEKMYSERNIAFDFRNLVVNLDSDKSGESIMPPYYMSLCLLGSVGDVSMLEVDDLIEFFNPSIAISDIKTQKYSYKPQTKTGPSYITGLLHIQNDPNFTQHDLVVRICCYFALYRLSESLRVKGKIGYYVMTDFTSSVYYSNFVIETTSVHTANEVSHILSQYIVDVVQSIEEMADDKFNEFLEVVYANFKLRTNKIFDIVHFYRSLDFKFDFITFNSELETLLYSVNMKTAMVEMLKNKTIISIME